MRTLVVGLLAIALWPCAASATLISYWPLDGNGNAVVGTSGTLVNGPTVVADRNGIPGGALGFAGSSQSYVQVSGGGGLNGAAAGSISMWVKWSGTQTQSVSSSYGDVLARQSNGQFSNDIIGLNGANPSTAMLSWQPYGAFGFVTPGGTALGDGTWRHIAVTFQSGQQRLYLDGVLDGTGTTPGSMSNNSGVPLAIGAWIGDGKGYSTSSIDDVGVFDNVISDQRIALINGLSRFAGVALNDPAIDAVLAVYTSKGGTATAGGELWTYDPSLAGPIGRTGGSVLGQNAFIVLGSGDGVELEVVPEPATLSFLALGGLALLRRRTRR